MESYDEDLNENSFFNTLKESHSDLFNQCVAEHWLICVPRRDSLPKYAFTLEDYFDHILKPNVADEIPSLSRRTSCYSIKADSASDSSSSSLLTISSDNNCTLNSGTNETKGSSSSWNYRTLSHVNADYRVNECVKLDEVVLQKSNNNILRRSKATQVNILFEETFYTENKTKYKVLCMESPLYSRMLSEDSNVEDLWSVSSLRDCIDFLWMKGKLRVLESYDAYIKLFLHNHRTLDNLPLAIQRDLVHTLYLKCLNFALTYENTLEGTNPQYILRVATETYVLNGVYRFLMGAITSALSQEDGYLNKIIRNLAEIHPQDLDIDEHHWDNLTRARLELGRLDIHTSPLAKLSCLKRTLRHMRPDPLMDSVDTTAISTDELLPIWVYLIVKTPLANWNAQLQYLSTFRFSVENHCDNENSFYMVTLEAALAHLKTAKVLGLAEGERDVGVPCELVDTALPNGNSKESSDCIVSEMFLAVKTGNSLRLEELVAEYEGDRKMQKVEVNKVDQSLLCHPLCNCERCSALVTPEPAVPIIIPVTELVKDDGSTLLHMACIHGRPKIVEFLVSIGVPMELTDCQGSTPLHLAASRGHQNALLLLLHAGANMEPLDKMGRTPLHLASQNGHEGCVKALVYYAEHSRQSLNFSSRDFNGNTPLHDASRWGFQGIVQILVENGASISITNNRLSTPVDCAHDIHIIRILQRSARRRSWVQPHHGDFINIEVVPNEESDGIVMLISEPTSASQCDEKTVSSENPSPVNDKDVNVIENVPSMTPVGRRARSFSTIIPPTFGNTLFPGHPGGDRSPGGERSPGNDRSPRFRRHSSIIAPSTNQGLDVLKENVMHHTPETETPQRGTGAEDFIINSTTTDEEVRRISRDESKHVRKISTESLDNIAVAILPELPAVMGVKRKRENQSRDMRKLFSAIALGDVPLSLFYLGIPADELESSENSKDVLERVPPCHPLCPCKRCVAKSGGLGLNINMKNMDGLTPLHMAVQYGLLSLVKVMYRFGADLNINIGYDNTSTLQCARSKGFDDIVAFLRTHGATE